MRRNGGYRSYGQSVGIILGYMVIQRPVGVVGHTDSFDFPVRYISAEGAVYERLGTRADICLHDPYVEAARELEAQGLGAIKTSCGCVPAIVVGACDASVKC